MFDELEFKKLIEEWKDLSQNQYEIRPWGIFTKFSTMHGGITLKEIVVKPMQRLSLQKHLRRDELWIFLSPDMIVDTIAPNGAKCSGCSIPVVRMHGVHVDWVQFPAARSEHSEQGMQRLELLQVALGIEGLSDVERNETAPGVQRILSRPKL